MISLHIDVKEAMQDITTLMAKTHPTNVGRATLGLFIEAMQLQQDEMFSSEGAGKWPQLSDWRVRDRRAEGVGSHPILVTHGTFQAEVARYHGDLALTGDGFNFVYPGLSEPSGRYWGITAGQRVNPLAAWTTGSRVYTGKGGKVTAGRKYRVATLGDRPIPMAKVPRPILFGRERVGIDSRKVIATYFGSVGLPLDEGVGGL